MSTFSYSILNLFAFLALAFSASHPIVVVHIAKTGGTMLRNILPEILPSHTMCEHRGCCVHDKVTALSTSGEFPNTCNLIDYEFRLAEAHIIFPAGLRDVWMLTMFRSPLEHAISAYFHMKRAEILKKESGDRIPDSFDDMLNYMESDNQNPLLYKLGNFQTEYMSYTTRDPTLHEAIRTLETFYWFGITEEMRLSVALLMCQVHGRIDVNLLNKVAAQHANKALNRLHVLLSPQTIRRFQSLNERDNRFYSMVQGMFWARVHRERSCLEEAGENLL